MGSPASTRYAATRRVRRETKSGGFSEATKVLCSISRLSVRATSLEGSESRAYFTVPV